jgi:hypothetical protein
VGTLCETRLSTCNISNPCECLWQLCNCWCSAKNFAERYVCSSAPATSQTHVSDCWNRAIVGTALHSCGG